MKLMITFLWSGQLLTNQEIALAVGCTNRSADVHFAHIPEVLLPDYKC